MIRISRLSWVKLDDGIWLATDPDRNGTALVVMPSNSVRGDWLVQATTVHSAYTIGFATTARSGRRMARNFKKWRDG